MFAVQPSADQTLAALANQWWDTAASPDERRVLRHLARYPLGRYTPGFQQASPLHAARFRPALNRLIALGLVMCPPRMVRVHPLVRASIPGLQDIAIIRPSDWPPPPKHRAPRKWSRQRARERMRKVDPSLVWSLDRLGRLVARKRKIGGKKTWPPWGTPAYGRALLARRGGLAAQRKLRAMGVNIGAILHAAKRKKALERAQKASERL